MKKFLLATFLCFGLFFSASAWAACDDGIKDAGEVGVDCGGVCTTECFALTVDMSKVGNLGGTTAILPLPQRDTGVSPDFVYDFYVDWGDGSAPDHITSYDQAERIHTYPANSTYQINISGSMPSWRNSVLSDIRFARVFKSLDSVGDVGFGVGVTNFGAMFYESRNLTDVVLFDTSAGIYFQNMFGTCISLTSVPQFDLTNGENFSYMFTGTAALTTVPASFNTPNGTNFLSMFDNSGVVTAPAMDLTLATTTKRMFAGASGLTSVPDYNTPLVTDFSYMFAGAVNLVNAPNLVTSNANTMVSMFAGCTRLETVPLYDANGASVGAIFSNCTSLTQGALSGTTYNIDYIDTAMEVDALRDVFANLSTTPYLGDQTINITGNPGQPSLTPADYASVMNNGWTVIPEYVPNCTDNVKNGDEVGVDCGGATCGECFAATFNTTSADESITLPLGNSYTYDFYIDWGDGTQDYITAYDQAEVTHTYSATGNHQINISGSFPYWKFYQTTTAPKLVSLDAQGDAGFGVGVTDFSRMYQGCSNLTDVSALSLPSGENFLAMFSQCTSLESVDLTDVSSGQDFGWMFYGNTSLSSVSTLYTPAGTNFDSMFYNCSSLTSIDMTDVSNGIYFSSMFRGATNLSSVTTMNTPLGEKFNHMFYQCPNLPNVPLSNVDSGTDFSQMFNGCSSLTSVSGLSTPSGENFYGMFANTGILTAELTDVSNGTNFGGMFTGASNLVTVEPMNTPLGQSFLAMFDGCSALQSFSLTDVGDGIDFTRFVDEATSLVSGVPTGAKYNLDYSGTALPYAALQALFAGVGTADNSGGQQTLDITGTPGVSSLTAADYAVVEAKDWVVIPAYTPTCSDGVQNGDEEGVDCGGSSCDACQAPFLATFRTTGANESITLPLISGYTYDFTVDWGDGTTSDITSYNDVDREHTYADADYHQISVTGASMPMWNFRPASGAMASKEQIISLDDVGDVGFGVGVTDFNGMFYGCANLTSVALFDTSAGLSFANMFALTNALTNIPLFDTSSGTNFSYMFLNATGVQTIPTLNTGAGTNFEGMFEGATGLTSVPVINTSLGTNFESMFEKASSLTTVPLIDTGAGTNFTNMFRSMTSLTSIPLINTAQGVSFQGMFAYSSSLTTIPLINTSLGQIFNGMFYGATGLTSVPLLDTSAGTVFTNMFAAVNNLIQGALSGTRYDIDYSDATMGVSALRDVFTEIGIADNSGGQQILDITGNPGVSELTMSDYAVVQDKGWVVVPAYEPLNTCANLTTAYFEKFFYHDNPQIQAITTALTDYQYYDCDNKIFRIGNASNQMEDISMMLALRLTTAELNTINTNQTATEGQSYYDTEARVFRRGQADGTLVTVNEDERRLSAAEISAITTAAEGEFYFNTTTRMFYIGESDGTLSQLFVQN